jgi:hypothetical protein
LIDRRVVDNDIGNSRGVDDRAEGVFEAGPIGDVGLNTTGVHPEPLELGQTVIDHFLTAGNQRNGPARGRESASKR